MFETYYAVVRFFKGKDPKIHGEITTSKKSGRMDIYETKPQAEKERKDWEKSRKEGIRLQGKTEGVPKQKFIVLPIKVKVVAVLLLWGFVAAMHYGII